MAGSIGLALWRNAFVLIHMLADRFMVYEIDALTSSWLLYGFARAHMQ